MEKKEVKIEGDKLTIKENDQVVTFSIKDVGEYLANKKYKAYYRSKRAEGERNEII